MSRRIGRARRRSAIVAVALIGLVLPWRPAPAEINLSSWSARGEAAAFYSTGDFPGFLPFSPVANVNLSFALTEMSVSQNHALSAPLWPGSVVGGVPAALALLGLPVPPEALQLVAGTVGSLYAESFYPNGGSVEGPVPPLGDLAAAEVGAGRASSVTAEDSASAISNASGIVAAGVIEVSGVKSTSSTKVDDTVVRASAASSLGRVDIAGVLTLEGVSAVAEFATDNDQPKASFGVASCLIAGVPCQVGLDGISIQGQAVSIPAASQANAALEALEQQGITVRLGKVVRSASGIEVNALDVTARVPLGAAAPSVPLPVSPPDSAAVSLRLSRAHASAQAGAVEDRDSLGEATGSTSSLAEPPGASVLGTSAGGDASFSSTGSPLPDTTRNGGNAAPANFSTVARVANLGPGAVLAAGLIVLLCTLGAGMIAVRRVALPPPYRSGPREV